MESVYGYFSYDVNTYIAGRLDSYQLQEGGERSPIATENTTRAEPSSSFSLSEDSEVPHAISMNTNSRSYNHISSPVREMKPPLSAVAAVSHMSRPETNAAETTSTNSQKKLLSSFTVENILMGRQSSSGSSNSPTSTTSSSLASPTLAPNEHSTIVGTNWVSHPPVKYTKFTMLSPNSMAEDTHKKKRTSAEGASDHSTEMHSHQLSRSSSCHDLNHSTALNSEEKRLGLKRVPSDYHRSSSDARNVTAPTRSAVTEAAASLIALSTSPSQKNSQNVTGIQSTNVVQPAKISTIPVVQALSASTDGKTAVLHQTFPPPQQFVLLVPSSSVAMSGHGLQAVVYAHPNQQVSQAQVNNHPVSSTSDSSSSSPPITKHNTSIITAPKSQLESSHKSHAPALTRTHSNGSDGKFTSSSKLSYQPIAPKSETAHSPNTSSTASPENNSNDKMKLYLKRTIQKPQKLRFHMTTVVNRPKKSSSTTSMTAQSPRACSNNDRGSPASENDHQSDSESNTPQPATITRSPNVFSTEFQVEQHTVTEDQVLQRGDHSPPISSSQKIKSEDLKRGAHPTQTAILKDSGFHLQVVKQRDSKSENTENVLSHRSKRNSDSTRGSGGRTTRSYTRRKRELTFHLYEDPSTAFKAKRTCKDSKDN